MEEFGGGSGAHFDETTLGHSRILVSGEEPDVMHILESQSDYYQKDANIIGNKVKSIGKEKFEEGLVKRKSRLQKTYDDILAKEKELKAKKAKGELNNGFEIQNYEIEQVETLTHNSKTALEEHILSNKNWEQKNLLTKTHQERLLQENVVEAVDKDISKVRYPTRETAVKIEGYVPITRKQSKKTIDVLTEEKKFLEEKLALSNNYVEKAVKDGDIYKTIDGSEYISLDAVKKAQDDMIKNYSKRLANTTEFLKKASKDSYSEAHETILRKYKDTPKMIKKTLGVETRVVTDVKGNTWYEFDIPENYKKGKAEIKALGVTGIVGAGAAGAAIRKNTNEDN